MRRRTLALVTTAAAVSLITAASAWAGNGGIAPPDSVTSSGGAINQLYWLVIGITAAIFLLVEGALIFFIVRYRRRKGSPDSEGPQIHGNTRLELIWTAIPALILAVILIVTIVKVPAVNAEQGANADPLVVEVVGHQFYWEYSYPNGVIAVDTLRLPVDRPVRLVLDAADVIHSWWVPQITGKRDAIPGKTNTLDFTPLDVGTYRGQCAELCGVQHAVMYTSVEVIGQQEFDEWLAAQAAGQAGPDIRCRARARAADVGRRVREVPRARRQGQLRPGDRQQLAPRRSGGTLTAPERWTGRGEPPRVHACRRSRLARFPARRADRLPTTGEARAGTRSRTRRRVRWP